MRFNLLVQSLVSVFTLALYDGLELVVLFSENYPTTAGLD